MKMKCENCGAGLVVDEFIGSLECQYCETLHFPTWKEQTESILLSSDSCEQICPVCNLNMVNAQLSHYNLNACTSCRGLLFDANELINLIVYLRKNNKSSARESEPIDPVDLQRLIKCPECKESMIANPYYGPGDFVIDYCKECSFVWLDGGELQKSVTVLWNGSTWK